jgi:subtilisin family serine protease
MKVSSRAPFVPGELLVRLRPEARLAAHGESVLGRLGEVVGRYPLGGQRLASDGFSGQEILHLKLDNDSPQATEQALRELSRDPAVAYAVTNDIVRSLDSPRLPNDLSPEQYGPVNISAPLAWAERSGDRTQAPLIAVIDSGIDYHHPDLAANVWTNPHEIPGNGIDDDGNGVVDDVHGFNAARQNGDPLDDGSHGTHVAGTVGAVGDNGQGVVGVAWQANLMAIKFLEKGYGDIASAIAGITYADAMGARVTQNSWGGSNYNQALVDTLAASPAIHICAAGNSAQDSDVSPAYPAAYPLPNIVAVAATDAADQLAEFSNWGAQAVDLAAPGAKILSTVPGGGLGVKSGTSMAAPHVSGAVSLILEKFPHLSNQQLKDRLLFSVDRLPQLEGKLVSGGRLNLAKAMEDDQLAPGAVSELSGQARSPELVELHWLASGDDGELGQAAAYEVAYSDRPFGEEEFDQQSQLRTPPPQVSGVRESLSFPVLPSARERQLFVAVRAVDNVGQRSPLTTTQVTVPAAQVAFEDGPDQWTREGDWGQEVVPERGLVWSDSPGGEYKLNQNASLTGRPFSLEQFCTARVRFDARHDLEINFDKVYLEARAGEENPWKTLHGFNLLDGWKTHQFDLSEFAGQKDVQLRFRLKTDGDVTRDGLQFHRLVVTGEPAETLPS